jgi:hypothetical protein
VGSWITAQLFWHMLCLGPSCQSAVLLSCSATKGATLLRLKRDDEYIGAMLRFVSVFYERFGSPARGLDGRLPPLPQDFFLRPGGEGRRERAEYRAFLERTRAIARSAEIIAKLGPDQVQRSPRSERLFLDGHGGEEEEESL